MTETGKCKCGGAMVWVRILSNNHRTQFCEAWVAREQAQANPEDAPWFTVEAS